MTQLEMFKKFPMFTASINPDNYKCKSYKVDRLQFREYATELR